MTKLVKQKRNPLNIKTTRKLESAGMGKHGTTCAQGVRVPRGKRNGVSMDQCALWEERGMDRKQDKMWGPSKVRGQTGDSRKKSGPPRMTTSMGEWEIKIHLQLEFYRKLNDGETKKNHFLKNSTQAQIHRIWGRYFISLMWPNTT